MINKKKTKIRQDFSVSSILVVGTLRDVENNIEKTLKCLDDAFSWVTNICWFLVESDSKDRTLSKLKILQKKYKNFRFISLGNLEKKLPLRSQRIGYCRQKYVEEIRSNVLYKNIQYVVVADLDKINLGLKKEAVRSCWDTKIKWDAVFANQPGGYYDIWALRHSMWSPADCFVEYNWLISNGVRPSSAYYKSVTSKLLKLNSNLDWISVNSAFGGIGIYKRYLFNKSDYIYNKDNKVQEMCEHVNFNFTLIDKGYSLYINPKFVNSYNTDHVLKMRLKYWILVVTSLSFFNGIKNFFGSKS